MKPNEKRFHRSNGLLYQYNIIYKDTALDFSQDATFLRRVVVLHASIAVSPEDIIKEFQDIEDKIERSVSLGISLSYFDPIMRTIMVEHEDFFVALTYSGFKRMALDVNKNLFLLKREKIERFAKEMCDARDQESNNGLT